jgi:hypothetical protein
VPARKDISAGRWLMMPASIKADSVGGPHKALPSTEFTIGGWLMSPASTVPSINIQQLFLPSNLPLALCPRGAREKLQKHQI